MLFTHAHGFWPKKYLSPSYFDPKHLKPDISMVSKYGNFLHVLSHSEIHLVYVYNLFDAIWCSFEQKQGVLRLLATTSMAITYDGDEQDQGWNIQQQSPTNAYWLI